MMASIHFLSDNPRRTTSNPKSSISFIALIILSLDFRWSHFLLVSEASLGMSHLRILIAIALVT